MHTCMRYALCKFAPKLLLVCYSFDDGFLLHFLKKMLKTLFFLLALL